jgi:hypothetical protein
LAGTANGFGVVQSEPAPEVFDPPVPLGGSGGEAVDDTTGEATGTVAGDAFGDAVAGATGEAPDLEASADDPALMATVAALVTATAAALVTARARRDNFRMRSPAVCRLRRDDTAAVS